MPLCKRIEAAFDLAYATPVRLRRIAVLLVAGDHTALAADTFRHVEMEPVLLSGSWLTRRDKFGGRPLDLDKTANAGRRGVQKWAVEQRKRRHAMPDSSPFRSNTRPPLVLRASPVAARKSIESREQKA